MGRGIRLFQVLGVNSVPAFGVLASEWTASTALALYWCENVFIALLVGLRLWLHRRSTEKRGHWEAGLSSGMRKAGSGSFLWEFLSTALILTAGHGLFLALILFLAIPEKFPDAAGVDPIAVLQGLGVISIFLLLGFLYDAIGLASRTFAWVRRLANLVLGRVIVVHLTIISGMVGMEWLGGPRGFFLVFAGFKTLSDVSAMTGGGQPAAGKPPGCLTAPMRLFAGDAKARRFAQHYETQHGLERWAEGQWEERREE
ncbi:MAG: hypothetical protein GY769_19030 [bacterium]|nr:hypothetical protein [bacterium]